MADEPELTQESLQAKLREYHAALRSEFEAATSKEQEDQATLEYFKKHIPVAAAQVVHLAQNSSSDSTRLSASKYIIDYVEKQEASTGGDPLANLLSDLKKNKKKSETETAPIGNDS